MMKNDKVKSQSLSAEKPLPIAVANIKTEHFYLCSPYVWCLSFECPNCVILLEFQSNISIYTHMPTFSKELSCYCCHFLSHFFRISFRLSSNHSLFDVVLHLDAATAYARLTNIFNHYHYQSGVGMDVGDDEMEKK